MLSQGCESITSVASDIRPDSGPPGLTPRARLWLTSPELLFSSATQGCHCVCYEMRQRTGSAGPSSEHGVGAEP